MKAQTSYQKGQVEMTFIIAVVMGVLFVVAGSLAIWAYINYDKQKSNVDSRIATAVSEAEKKQADEDEKKFSEREKEPNRQFAGPDDFGRVVFYYPKTWSVYEKRDIERGDTYEAYLHPIVVPMVTSQQKYALRIAIETDNYDDVLKKYESLIKNGKLKSTPYSANGHTGTRLDGDFSNKLRGAAIFLKLRDKTITVRTDAPVFYPDFENVIKTIDFNQ